MSPRLRKFIGMFGILGFCTAYVVLIITLGGLLPDHWLARLVFYGVAGTVWGFPLFPLFRWMNHEPPR